jgi:hypothetical protein
MCFVVEPFLRKESSSTGVGFGQKKEAGQANLNPNSLEVLPDTKLEPSLAVEALPEPVQFREAGLFRPRRGLAAGRAGIQPHRLPARHLGQGERRRITRRSRRSAPARSQRRAGFWRVRRISSIASRPRM